MVSKGDKEGPVEINEELRRLLNRAKAQGDVILTENGEEVGKICASPPKRSPEEIEAAIRALEEFASRHTLGGLSWKELRDEGRKW